MLKVAHSCLKLLIIGECRLIDIYNLNINIYKFLNNLLFNISEQLKHYSWISYLPNLPICWHYLIHTVINIHIHCIWMMLLRCIADVYISCIIAFHLQNSSTDTKTMLENIEEQAQNSAKSSDCNSDSLPGKTYTLFLQDTTWWMLVTANYYISK